MEEVKRNEEETLRGNSRISSRRRGSIVDDNLRPKLRKMLRDSESDPFRTTGHKSCFSCERHFFLFLLCFLGFDSREVLITAMVE